MTFLQPWILLFIPLVLIPGILYWLRRRQTPTVKWAAMSILKQAFEQTQPRRRQSELIRLILQTILIGVVIAAVAQPVFLITQSKIVDKPILSPPAISPAAGLKTSDTAKTTTVLFVYQDNVDKIDNSRAALFLSAGLNQILSPVEFTKTELDKLNPVQVEQSDIVVFHAVKQIPVWLAETIKRRVEQFLPVWFFALNELDEQSRQSISSVLPAEPKSPLPKIDSHARLYEGLNSESDLWKSPVFNAVKSQKIPFPSQENCIYESTQGWQSAFTDSTSLISRNNTWIFSSPIDGQKNAWPLCSFWIPLLDRVTTVSLNSSANVPAETHLVPGSCWLSIVLSSTGLLLLIWLFVQFKRSSSQYPKQERRLGTVSFIAVSIILFIMIIQAQYTPVSFVKPAVLFLQDDTLSMNLPSESNIQISRTQFCNQWLKSQQKAIAELSDKYQFSSSTFSQPVKIQLLSPKNNPVIEPISAPQGTATNPIQSVKIAQESLCKKIDFQALKKIIILSDGRSTDDSAPANWAEVKLNSNSSTQIIAAQIGSDKPQSIPLIEKLKAQQNKIPKKSINVLMVSNGPNWEFRYLRNLLARTDYISLSVVLQNAAPEYIHEDSCAIEQFPQSAEQLNVYDILIFISPNLDLFTQAQSDALREFFRINQKSDTSDSSNAKAVIGFWNSNYNFAPLLLIDNRWLPFDIGSLGNKPISSAKIKLSPLGQTESWLKLFSTSNQSSNNQSDWNSLPELGTIVPVTHLKPFSRVLALDSISSNPLIVEHAVGNINVVSILTDSLWRWRRGKNELYYNRFQLQMIRALANKSNPDSFDNTLPLEYQYPTADRESLNQAAVQTGGKFYTESTLDSIQKILDPQPEKIRIVRPTVIIWNQPLLLTLLLLILFIDWTRYYLFKKAIL